MDNNILDFLMPLMTNFGKYNCMGNVCALLFVFDGVKVTQEILDYILSNDFYLIVLIEPLKL